jgi:hypothetical protein
MWCVLVEFEAIPRIGRRAISCVVRTLMIPPRRTDDEPP